MSFSKCLSFFGVNVQCMFIFKVHVLECFVEWNVAKKIYLKIYLKIPQKALILHLKMFYFIWNDVFGFIWFCFLSNMAWAFVIYIFTTNLEYNLVTIKILYEALLKQKKNGGMIDFEHFWVGYHFYISNIKHYFVNLQTLHYGIVHFNICVSVVNVFWEKFDRGMMSNYHKCFLKKKKFLFVMQFFLFFDYYLKWHCIKVFICEKIKKQGSWF